MPPLQMSFACGLYDRMNALYTGEVKPEGIDLNFLAIHHPRDVFDRMVGGHEFDASELSASEYICRYAAGDRQFIALPVFPSRAFRHGFIAVNDRTVKEPKDLNGKKVGVQLYTMTAAVWIRGLLQQAGVDLGSIEWVEGAVEHPGTHGKPTVLPPLKPVKITQNTNPEKSISDLLADGEIDATIGADLPTSFGKAEHVKRLFPDFKAAEKKYYKEHGIFPIMHLVVVRSELYEKYPFIASSLYEAFDKSKNMALARMKSLSALRYMMPWLPEALDDIEEVFGDDPWPYGVEANRKTLEALVQNLVDQSMIEKSVSVDELFAVCRPNQFPVG
jgi:4,5-dihydroxyphthalate decarboxylase